MLGTSARSVPTGGIFKTAAVEVLRRTRRLMPTGEICRLALEWGLLSCSGKTPEATMASALYGDIKRKDRRSVFIRPQEGLFGLREWVDLGYLPALPQPMAPVPATASSGAAAAGGAKRSGSGPRSGRRSRPKKARRVRDEDSDEDWSGEDEMDEDEDEQCTAGHTEAPAATAQLAGLAGLGGFAGGFSAGRGSASAPSLRLPGNPTASPLRKLLSMPYLPINTLESEPTLNLDLLADGSGAQAVSGSPGAAGAGPSRAAGKEWPHLDLPATSAAAASVLTSPPLYMALASPAPRGLTAGAEATTYGGSGTSGGREPALFSPRLFPTLSPCPGTSLPSFDATPGALPCRFPSMGDEVATAPPAVPSGLPPPATAGTGAAALVVIKGEHSLPLAGISWVPTAVDSAAAAATAQQHRWLPAAALPAAQQTPVGESTGGCAGGGSADVLGGIGAMPLPLLLPALPGSLQLKPLTGSIGGLSCLGGATGATGSSQSSVLSKIAELEAKVKSVEARWGALHPQTGRAHLLLYHACRHRAAALACRERGEAALQRACAVLKAQGSESEGLAKDYDALLAAMQQK